MDERDWMDELEPDLAEPLARLRGAARHERSPEWRKAALLGAFDRVHRPARRFPREFAIAASVVAVLSAGLMWQSGPPAERERAPVAIASTSEFVVVPYAPPLAAGEMVKVVRGEFETAALHRMGFVAPSLSGDAVEAEVMLGQDGLPRAIRVLAEEGYRN
jgi:hypothetical protein